MLLGPIYDNLVSKLNVKRDLPIKCTERNLIRILKKLSIPKTNFYSYVFESDQFSKILVQENYNFPVEKGQKLKAHEMDAAVKSYLNHGITIIL